MKSILTQRHNIWYTVLVEGSIKTRDSALERKYGIMLVSFLNSFMSYFMVMLVIVVVAGVASAIGITMAKKKAAQEAAVASIKGGNE